MSEFFKALEQAERDRARQDQAEATSAAPPPRVSPGQNGAAGTDRAQATVAEPPAVKERAQATVAEPPAVKERAQATVAEPPAVKEHAQATVAEPPAVKERAQAVVAEPPTVVPEPIAVPARTRELISPRVPSPASVFRPSLRRPDRAPLLGRGNGRPPVLVTQTNPASVEAEAYRTVRANIELMSENGAFRHIAITSAAGGDGKSTTAANLAVVAAQGGRRVCLVDADLRRPTVHDIFGLPNVDGLAAALQFGKPLHAVAKAADVENLSVVVAGRGVDENSHDVLTPHRLEKVLEGSEAAFDVVIFDGPPIISADALSLAAVCGEVIFVVKSGSIPFSVLRRAIGQVKQVKGRVLGVLLNRVDLRSPDAESYRHYRAYDATRQGS